MKADECCNFKKLLLNGYFFGLMPDSPLSFDYYNQNALISVT